MASLVETAGAGRGDGHHTDPDTPADAETEAASELRQPLPGAPDGRDALLPPTQAKDKHVAGPLMASEPEPLDNMASSVATIKAPKATLLNNTIPNTSLPIRPATSTPHRPPQ